MGVVYAILGMLIVIMIGVMAVRSNWTQNISGVRDLGGEMMIGVI
jgi:hypothetical protein